MQFQNLPEIVGGRLTFSYRPARDRPPGIRRFSTSYEEETLGASREIPPTIPHKHERLNIIRVSRDFGPKCELGQGRKIRSRAKAFPAYHSSGFRLLS